MPSAVLFDFNGVLVDDEALHRRAFNDVLAPLGIEMTEQAYVERYLGFDDRGAFEAVLADHARAVDAALVASLIAAKATVYAREAAAHLRIYPGAAELFRTIAARVPVGIVSGALRAEIELALARMDLAGRAAFVVAAEDVRACKPDPEGYRAAYERLRAASPSLLPREVVAIEDSLAGIESARGAGLTVVAVAHSYPRHDLERAGAALVADVIGDLTWERIGRV